MKVTSALVAMLVLTAASVSQGANPTSASTSRAEQEIREVETKRFASMVSRDMTALDRTLAHDLSYTHTTGVTQTKEEFLRALDSGEPRYEAIEPEAMTVRIFGDVGIINGVSKMRLSVDGKKLSFRIRFTDAYVRRAGNWELVTWQATRLPEPAGGGVL